MAAETLTSTAMSLENSSSSLDRLWMTLGSSLRSGWTLLLSDELLRNFYLSLYNDAADPTRRPVATSGESPLNDPASGKQNLPK